MSYVDLTGFGPSLTSSRVQHIGRRRRRLEDRRLVTGRGAYAADIAAAGAAYMTVRRSDLAHAQIRRIDATRARRVPGVLAVLTWSDLPPTARHITDHLLPPALAGIGRPVLADRQVNHVGEALAAVIASDMYVAEDAARLVDVDLESLPAAGTLEAALAAGAPPVHPMLGTNAGLWETDGFGDVDSAFDGGGISVRDRLVMGRVAGAAIEPRACLAVPNNGRVAVWTSTQAVFRVRELIAEALNLGVENVVVRAPDVGGGFGPKGRRYAEDVLAALAAMRLGVPVRWVASRGEDTATSMQAHGSIFELELAADLNGRLTGLRGAMWHDIGAYPSVGAILPGSILRNMLCTYRLPALAFEVFGVFTNTTPTGTVRGGPGPEGNFAMERMMDLLADRLGMQPADLRKRNLLEPGQLPYAVHLSNDQFDVDGGDFPKLLDEVQRRVRAPAVIHDGRLRGVGLAMGVEVTATLFRSEPARIRLHKDGTVDVVIGSSPGGQGHETMAAHVVASRLGWPIERINVHAGDTDLLARAGPTASSRSAISVGNAVALASRAARQVLLDAAALGLELDPGDLTLEGGFIAVKGGRQRHAAADFLPVDGIDVTETWEAGPEGASSSSCHAVEVAVDPATGAVEVERYVIAYDAGVVINPLIVDGQLSGGVAHGVGYGLFEEVVYDTEGELLTPTFHEYLIAGPTEIAFSPTLVPCPTRSRRNAEGFRGAGETGVIAAPAAIAAAIEAAVRQVAPGARISEIPVRPEAILRLVGSSRPA